ARIADAGAYTHAGPEIGVASTKAFTAQLAVLYLIALKVAQLKGTIEATLVNKLLADLPKGPEHVKEILEDQDAIIQEITRNYSDARDVRYLGRGYNVPIALEGALKLKEVSYIHAEGYPAAEMKHGPIALVDDQLPVVFVATKDSYHEKIISNSREIKARKGKVIAVVSHGDEVAADLADDVMFVPQVHEIIAPILSVIPLQLLSYYIGVHRGLDVDKPRNLAKSVTVE